MQEDNKNNLKKKVKVFFGAGNNSDRKAISNFSYSLHSEQNSVNIISSFSELSELSPEVKSECLVVQVIFGLKSGADVYKAIEDAKTLVGKYREKFPELLHVDFKEVNSDYYGMEKSLQMTFIPTWVEFKNMSKLTENFGVEKINLNLKLYNEIPRGTDLYMLSITREKQDNDYIRFDLEIDGEIDKIKGNESFIPKLFKKVLDVRDEPIIKTFTSLNNINLKLITENPEEYLKNSSSEILQGLGNLFTFNKARKYICSLISDILALNEDPQYTDHKEFFKENIEVYSTLRNNFTSIKKLNVIHGDQNHTLTIDNFNILDEYFPTIEELQSYAPILQVLPSPTVGLSANGVQILLIGLESSGKTSILNQLSGQYYNVSPTKGVNVSKFNYSGYDLVMYDVGGGDKVRPYWNSFISPFIIYVMDQSVSTAGLMMQKNVLVDFVNNNNLHTTPILVLINKEDQGKVPAADLMSMVSVKDRITNEISYQTCSAVNYTGTTGGLDWLITKISEAGYLPADQQQQIDNFDQIDYNNNQYDDFKEEIHLELD
jgi:signal recognition particle receptor subunit beta